MISKNPEYLQPYLYAASLTLEEEVYDLALRYVNAGLKIEPDNLTLLFYKGIALVESDQEEKAAAASPKHSREAWMMPGITSRAIATAGNKLPELNNYSTFLAVFIPGPTVCSSTIVVRQVM